MIETTACNAVLKSQARLSLEKISRCVAFFTLISDLRMVGALNFVPDEWLSQSNRQVGLRTADHLSGIYNKRRFQAMIA
jgi:hypothetical protein